MSVAVAKDYYYDKGWNDCYKSTYDQPFPNPMLLELDEFELRCNAAYNKGYNDEKEGKSYAPPNFDLYSSI